MQYRCVDETGIGRHQIPRIQEQDIATHHLRRGNDCGVTTTHDPGPGRSQARQRRHGPLGAIFLEKAEHRVEYHDSEDGDAVDDLAECRGDKSRPDQHPDHQATELPCQEC